MDAMKVQFFRSPAALQKWFAKHHATSQGLWVGYFKVGTGKASITWPESVDEALCVGWIDGIRKSVDASSYAIRFTPRKRTSVWSAVNIKRAQALMEEGRMQPEGLRAFEARKENRSGIYSYEQRTPELPDPYGKLLRKNKAAWDHFHAQAPWYRKTVCWWVVSAKKEETRLKRLGELIECSASGITIPQLTREQKGRS
jgi:uncharacterized protein YdeI (YjbR/CyaY-like superfamily)